MLPLCPTWMTVHLRFNMLLEMSSKDLGAKCIALLLVLKVAFVSPWMTVHLRFNKLLEMSSKDLDTKCIALLLGFNVAFVSPRMTVRPPRPVLLARTPWRARRLAPSVPLASTAPPPRRQPVGQVSSCFSHMNCKRS